MKRLVYSIVIVVFAGLLYQSLFRFENLKQYGKPAARIDHLLGTICNMPCLAIDDQDYGRQQKEENDRRVQVAIGLARSFSSFTNLPSANSGSGYTWSDETSPYSLSSIRRTGSPKADVPDKYLVCWCDKTNFGWRFEVDTRTSTTLSINDNRVLMKRYGLDAPLPSPIPTKAIAAPKTPSDITFTPDTPRPVATKGFVIAPRIDASPPPLKIKKLISNETPIPASNTDEHTVTPNP